MEAQEYYIRNKKKTTIENEYFIAMDKASFFQMMDDYADFKVSQVELEVLESDY